MSEQHGGNVSIANDYLNLEPTYSWCILTSSSRPCEFKVSNAMPTYLVAFVVEKSFQKSCAQSVTKAISAGPQSLCVWYRKSAANQHKYALDMARKALSYFSEHLQIDYFTYMNKMDMVAVPDFAYGAMENWGLVTYRESALLYEEQESSEAAKQRVGTVIVHEMAHQWFGNLVSPEWWAYMWLNEGFAGYYQFMATHAVRACHQYTLFCYINAWIKFAHAIASGQMKYFSLAA